MNSLNKHIIYQHIDLITIYKMRTIEYEKANGQHTSI